MEPSSKFRAHPPHYRAALRLELLQLVSGQAEGELVAAPLVLELVDAVKDLANRDVENVSVICKLGKQNVKIAS